MKSFEFLDESINDKGIFKAVFFAGIPGAGKSYVLTEINDGGIDARIVNTDKMLEFLAKSKDIDISSKENQKAILDKSKTLTINQLANYINGMLPLFIDGTSSNASSTLRRSGILESFGYDVGMIWVDTDLDVAIKRAQQRERKVDEDFIRAVYEKSAANKEFFAEKFNFFKTINNNDGELSDKVILKAFKEARGFFEAPLKNPIGNRIIEKLKEEHESYLVPTIFSKDEIIKAVSQWYAKGI